MVLECELLRPLRMSSVFLPVLVCHRFLVYLTKHCSCRLVGHSPCDDSTDEAVAWRDEISCSIAADAVLLMRDGSCAAIANASW